MAAWIILGALAALGAAFAIVPLVRARGARVLGLAIGVATAGAALALYIVLGRPELAVRAFTPPNADDLPALVSSLVEKMHENPNDLRGWLWLGQLYFALGEKGEAAKALGVAVRLARAQHVPQTQLAVILSDYGVALTQASGTVTPDAEVALRESLAADPMGMIPRYYLGIAAASRGDAATAERLWESVLADTPTNAPYRGEIVDRLAALKAARGEAAPDVQAMVEGLAQRLKASPGDLDGWRRLIRAYAVLGDGAKARASLATARSHFTGNPAALAALAEIAHANRLE